ncbi:hypothetical protein [Pseudaminobacter soli (ex Zhang et al. 2022)]|uniref:hypothetical protein n=1 Tax=Pseudaminobacter soli (ex Zhang et al. 2022) TaxID=2831468 RepID=UPI00307FF1FC
MALAGILAAGAAVSGCVGSPTYGTDKTANEQLMSDVSNILALGPKERQSIDYKPRPELVKPAKGSTATLPEPQQSVASAENPAWPESPEQKRARLRAEADENRDKPGWRPQIEPDLARATARPREATPTGQSARYGDSGVTPVGINTTKQSEEFRKKLAEERQGSPTNRKYLSEPPLEYRQAAATAPTGDVGEDEIKKERRLKAQARKNKGFSLPKWADINPF